jgi:hypothetical protein
VPTIATRNGLGEFMAGKFKPEAVSRQPVAIDNWQLKIGN